MTAPTIYIQHASLAYRKKPVFSDLNLTLRAGKWTALLGPSGVGKSSLLRYIAGITTADETSSGLVTTDNNVTVKNELAYMAQTDLLLPWLTILENCLLGYKLRGGISSDAIGQAQTLLLQVGLADYANHYPYQLSGGMRQRVALVRTLIENKSLVLMDEPFSALDAVTRFQLHEIAAKLLRHKTVLFVTHDPVEALRMADDIYVLHPAPLALSHLATLQSDTPRALDHADVIRLQAVLYANLTAAHAAGVAA